MAAKSSVRLDAPANAGIVRCLSSPERLTRSVSLARDRPDCAPDAVTAPYLHLGAHPDLLRRLWEELTVKLPVDCRWIVYGTPVLVCPASGVIFAFGEGTHTYALRLPPQERQEALDAGATRLWKYPAYPSLNREASELNLDDIGPEWVFGRWLRGEEDWTLAAYRFADEA